MTLVLGFLAGLMWRDTRRTPPEPPRDVVRFTISLPPGELFAVDQSSPPSLAISPGGERIAYVVRGRDGDWLYLQQRRDPVPVPLAGTEGALGPFFSPDAQWIGFASGGMLRKMAVNGGAPSALAPAPNFGGRRGRSMG